MSGPISEIQQQKVMITQYHKDAQEDKSKGQSVLHAKTTILDYSHSLIWSCEPLLPESINNEKSRSVKRERIQEE